MCPIVAVTRENARRESESSRAELYREFLQAASIDEPAFFVETATHLMIDFRSLRDSGITWRFLAGERAEVVQRESGHEHISTTLGYAKEVHDRRGRYGEGGPSDRLAQPLAQRGRQVNDSAALLVEEAGFERCGHKTAVDHARRHDPRAFRAPPTRVT